MAAWRRAWYIFTVGRLAKAAGTARASGKRQPRARSRPESLGERLRIRRQERGLRRVDLAKLTDLAVSFLSQVERGLTNPGMRSLILMAEALEVRPHSLLEDRPQSDSPWIITRAADQSEVANDGGTARSITNLNPAFSAFDFSGGPRKFFTYYRPAEDVLLILMAGQLEVELETEKVVLAAGDTLFVRAGVNHRWRQVGRARCRVLCVMRAPQGNASNDSMLDVFSGLPDSGGADDR